MNADKFFRMFIYTVIISAAIGVGVRWWHDSIQPKEPTINSGYVEIFEDNKLIIHISLTDDYKTEIAELEKKYSQSPTKDMRIKLYIDINIPKGTL